MSRGVSYAQDAVAQLESTKLVYDCVILHPLYDDLRRLSVKQTFDCVTEAVQLAIQRATSGVVLSLQPIRSDSSASAELSQKYAELYKLLNKEFAKSPKVFICDHVGLADGKLASKYFKDQHNLSSEGLTKVSTNLKEGAFYILRNDKYVKSRHEQGLLQI